MKRYVECASCNHKIPEGEMVVELNGDLFCEKCGGHELFLEYCRPVDDCDCDLDEGRRGEEE